MSFANDCKTELAQLKIGGTTEVIAELEALLRMGSELIIRNGSFTISFETSNALVARRFLNFVKKEYNAQATLLTHQVKKLNQGIHYNVVLESEASTIIEELNLLGDLVNNESIEENEISRRAYLRGSFLARGSLNDPKNGDYHLEITTSSQNDALFIQRLMNSFELNAKIVKRRNDYVIYLKDISSISDFLRIIGASKTAFTLDDLVIKREYKANITRQMNAEIANEMKTLSAAKKQIHYINVIKFNYPLDKLDPKILLIMKVRLEHTDASLTELIDILNNEYGEKITKSGINHRFIKIKELAKEIEQTNKEDELDRKSNLN